MISFQRVWSNRFCGLLLTLSFSLVLASLPRLQGLASPTISKISQLFWNERGFVHWHPHEALETFFTNEEAQHQSELHQNFVKYFSLIISFFGRIFLSYPSRYEGNAARCSLPLLLLDDSVLHVLWLFLEEGDWILAYVSPWTFSFLIFSSSLSFVSFIISFSLILTLPSTPSSPLPSIWSFLALVVSWHASTAPIHHSWRRSFLERFRFIYEWKWESRWRWGKVGNGRRRGHIWEGWKERERRFRVRQCDERAKKGCSWCTSSCPPLQRIFPDFTCSGYPLPPLHPFSSHLSPLVHLPPPPPPPLSLSHEGFHSCMGGIRTMCLGLWRDTTNEMWRR